MPSWKYNHHVDENKVVEVLVQSKSSAKNVPALSQARMCFIIAPILLLNIVLMIPKQTLLSTNLMTLPLRKATSLHIQLLPAITKGRNQVIKIPVIFNGGVSKALWLFIKLIMLTLEELFTFSMHLKIHQLKKIMTQLLLGTWTHILSTLTFMIPLLL